MRVEGCFLPRWFLDLWRLSFILKGTRVTESGKQGVFCSDTTALVTCRREVSWNIRTPVCARYSFTRRREVSCYLRRPVCARLFIYRLACRCHWLLSFESLALGKTHRGSFIFYGSCARPWPVAETYTGMCFMSTLLIIFCSPRRPK